MTLEELFDMWATDARIDSTRLDRESLDIPILHHKYLRLFSIERRSLTRMETALKGLKAAKARFFTEGPDEETREKGWKLPPRGRILKAEVSSYVESDREVIELGVRVAEQGELVAALQEIVRSISNRNFIIKNSIDYLKFTNGQ